MAKSSKDVPAILSTCTDIEMSDLGCRFSFGEIPVKGDPVYHTSVFLPIQYVPVFEGLYKETATRYLEVKAKQQKEKKK